MGRSGPQCHDGSKAAPPWRSQRLLCGFPSGNGAGIIAACALFARAFNQLAKADVWEQTFWDSDKKEEILTYMIRFPNSGFKVQALSSRPSNLRGLQGTW
ncbi:putative phage portal protein [Escherichia coli]|nr:putative phage portal protein [Escherichia coli]